MLPGESLKLYFLVQSTPPLDTDPARLSIRHGEQTVHGIVRWKVTLPSDEEELEGCSKIRKAVSDLPRSHGRHLGRLVCCVSDSFLSLPGTGQ